MDSNQDLENNKQSTDGLSAGVDNEVKTVDKLEQENAMMNTAPKKKGSTMVLGMVLMAIAMICGIGFGVWTMIDAEAQKKELNSQISSLKQENNDLQNQINELSDDEEMVTDVKADGKNSMWPVTAALVGSSFYVINDSDIVVAKDKTVDVAEIIGCSSPIGGPEDAEKYELTCGVMVAGGDSGAFLYDGSDGSLTYIVGVGD